MNLRSLGFDIFDVFVDVAEDQRRDVRLQLEHDDRSSLELLSAGPEI